MFSRNYYFKEKQFEQSFSSNFQFSVLYSLVGFLFIVLRYSFFFSFMMKIRLLYEVFVDAMILISNSNHSKHFILSKIHI